MDDELIDRTNALLAIQELHKPQLIEDFYNYIDGSSTSEWHRVCSTCDTGDYPCDTRKLADEALGGGERG